MNHQNKPPYNFSSFTAGRKCGKNSEKSQKKCGNGLLSLFWREKNWIKIGNQCIIITQSVHRNYLWNVEA